MAGGSVGGMPLHYVDPYKKRGRWYTPIESFSRSRPGQWYARHVASRIDPWLYRKTGGRYPSIFGGPSTAPLLTTGAKSGLPREHQITYFHDGHDPIVTASNYGGPKHPQWYYNLKANPECGLGDEKFLANEITDPDEYARVYGLAEQVYAGWSDYRVKTDPIGRHIPVFRLKPR
jgi:deazaflavin-dependent oxidoreductase (nitroreductase family)